MTWANNSPSDLATVLRIVHVCILIIAWNLDLVEGGFSSFTAVFLGGVAFCPWKCLKCLKNVPCVKYFNNIGPFNFIVA